MCECVCVCVCVCVSKCVCVCACVTANNATIIQLTIETAESAASECVEMSIFLPRPLIDPVTLGRDVRGATVSATSAIDLRL